VLIPSIDLQGGKVVQLEQGERLVFATEDLDGWLARFASSPLIQVIDLDAAMGSGENRQLVRRICAERPCQVGGGIRTIEAARDVLDAGARRIIVGSVLYSATGVDANQAASFADAFGPEALIGAVDSRKNQVVIHGWRTPLPLSPVEAVQQLDPYVGTYLYTHVDGEGLLKGLNMAAVRAVKAATTRGLIAAGGIRSRDEVDTLHWLGIDAVVGMAIYRGLMTID
jgi:phosphoribosylformimino-5-aminoimidazole carboxamide ribotide isomerase